MEIIPSPVYSLCNFELVSECVSILVNRGVKNQNIYNILDPVNYKQKDISLCFSNIKIPVYKKLLEPIYYLSYLLNNRKGYHFRCLYWKLFNSNIYVSNFEKFKFI